MNAPVDVKNKNFVRWASLAGFFGFYPVLAAFTRTYLHVHVPTDYVVDLVMPAVFFSPQVLFLCGGILLGVGSGWFRALGAFYFLTLAWWVWMLLTNDF